MPASTTFFLTALAAGSTIHQALAAYTLVDSFQGATFFDDFDFFTAADPTSGFVEYVGFDTAKSNELIGQIKGYGQDSPIYMGLDFQTKLSASAGGRQSVRIQSRQSWTHGLAIADIGASPSGCGTWPALWFLSHSSTWPGTNGEIDFFETVNMATSNAMTLHTDDGCAVTNASTTFSGTMTTEDCYVDDPNQTINAGCSIVAPTNNTIVSSSSSYSRHSSGHNITTTVRSTAGSEFNTQGGGVYTMEWTSTNLTFHFFPRGYIPSDITSGAPVPSTWTQTPLAVFSGCDFDAHLSNLSLVINTSLCGSYAGNSAIWADGGCAAKTGQSTCDAFAAASPSAFANAYWLINSVKMYQVSDSGTSSTASTNGSNSSSSASSSSSSVKAKRAHGGSAKLPTIDLAKRGLVNPDTAAADIDVDAIALTSSAISLRAGIEQEGAASSRVFAVLAMVAAVAFAALMA